MLTSCSPPRCIPAQIHGKQPVLLPWPSPDVSQAWMRIDSSIDHKKGEIIVEERVDNFEDHSTALQCRSFLLSDFFAMSREQLLEAG